MFNIPPLGYSIYTAKRTSTSKSGVVEYMDKLRDIVMEGGRDSFDNHVEREG